MQKLSDKPTVNYFPSINALTLHSKLSCISVYDFQLVKLPRYLKKWLMQLYTNSSFIFFLLLPLFKLMSCDSRNKLLFQRFNICTDGCQMKEYSQIRERKDESDANASLQGVCSHSRMFWIWKWRWIWKICLPHLNSCKHLVGYLRIKAACCGCYLIQIL